METDAFQHFQKRTIGWSWLFDAGGVSVVLQQMMQEASVAELRKRQRIDLVLDEVSETSFSAVVIMVEHQRLKRHPPPTHLPTAAILETVERR